MDSIDNKNQEQKGANIVKGPFANAALKGDVNMEGNAHIGDKNSHITNNNHYNQRSYYEFLVVPLFLVSYVMIMYSKPIDHH